MKLVTYSQDGTSPRPGVLVDDKEVVDTRAVAELAGFAEPEVSELVTNRDVLGLGTERLRSFGDVAEGERQALVDRGAVVALDRVRLGPPVPNPEKIVCLGLNYHDHAAEAGLTPPDAPMFFCKFANSLVGPADSVIPPKITDQVDYEAELAVVIGSLAHEVNVADALSHVAGAMALNDVSARDLQLANPLWTGGKAIDTFAPCGPALVTLDALGSIDDLDVCTRVNGQTVQDGNTGSMIFDVPSTIAFLSQIMTLIPGDIIATGTPAGVGNAREPKLFLRPGDEVEVEIEGIGRLGNRIVAA